MRRAVLPLTREWIEIDDADGVSAAFTVLPLTREWIEIVKQSDRLHRWGSPSYEGVD